MIVNVFLDRRRLANNNVLAVSCTPAGNFPLIPQVCLRTAGTFSSWVSNNLMAAYDSVTSSVCESVGRDGFSTLAECAARLHGVGSSSVALVFEMRSTGCSSHLTSPASLWLLRHRASVGCFTLWPLSGSTQNILLVVIFSSACFIVPRSSYQQLAQVFFSG